MITATIKTGMRVDTSAEAEAGAGDPVDCCDMSVLDCAEAILPGRQ